MNIQQMMQQAKQMQEKMQVLQGELEKREVEGESGGGLVKVVMTCKGEVRKLEISPEVINPSDKETMEDLIVAAVNMARQHADEMLATETQQMMQEMGLPQDIDLGAF